MLRIQPFEIHTDQYESWFERHSSAYLSELVAVRQCIPQKEEGIEIGVGSGRFAMHLGIRFGIEPAMPMAVRARDRGVCVVRGLGETLPIRDARFDFALMVTTICFLEDPGKTLSEIHRILRPNGTVLIGFVDKNSDIGKIYFKNKNKSLFYREARFFSVEEILNLLDLNRFNQIETVQTLFSSLEETTRIEPVKPGSGEGSFVVIKAHKN